MLNSSNYPDAAQHSPSSRDLFSFDRPLPRSFKHQKHYVKRERVDCISKKSRQVSPSPYLTRYDRRMASRLRVKFLTPARLMYNPDNATIFATLHVLLVVLTSSP